MWSLTIEVLQSICQDLSHGDTQSARICVADLLRRAMRRRHSVCFYTTILAFAGGV